MGTPPNKKGSLKIVKLSKERGILRLLSNSYGRAQFRLQENRRGRVLGIHIPRPSLENNHRNIFKIN